MKRLFFLAFIACASVAYAAWTYSPVREAGSSANGAYLVTDSGSTGAHDTIYSDTIDVSGATTIGIALSMKTMTFADSALDDSANAIIQVCGKMHNAALGRVIYTDTLAKDNIDAATVSDTSYRNFRCDLLPIDRIYFITYLNDSSSTASIVPDTDYYQLTYEILQK